MKTYVVSIACSWIEEVRANDMKDAIKKTEKKYRYGKGHFPREYVEVTPTDVDWCEIE